MTIKLQFGLPVHAEGLVQMDCREIPTFWDDFLDTSISSTVDVSRWKGTVASTGVLAVIFDGTDASQELAGGIVSLGVGADVSDASSMLVNGEAWQIDQGYELYYECRFTRTDTDISCFVGLTASDASAIAGVVNGIGFKTVGAALNTVCDNAGGSENVDEIGGVTIVALTWDRVAIHYDGLDTVKFYHAQDDDELVLVNTLKLSTETDYVPQDLMMTPTLEAEEQTAGGAGSMYVDYVLVQQRRCRVAE